MRKLLMGIMVLLFSATTAANGYTNVQTQQPARGDGQKIEIESVFWYGCPYCQDLEPRLQKLAKDLPDDVELISVPAPLNPSWALHARAYHVAKHLDMEDRLHQRFFREIQASKGRAFHDLESLVRFMKRYGADEDEVRKAAEHPAVISAMRSDAARLTAYGLRQVPALIVGGKYMVTAQSAGGIGRMTGQALEIAEKIREGQL